VVTPVIPSLTPCLMCSILAVSKNKSIFSPPALVN
jgi:hypothetical protein